jgi:hypothetical protein
MSTDTGNAQQPGRSRGDSWPVVVATGVGFAAGAGGGLLLVNYVAFTFPWCTLAFLAASLAGFFLGRLVGRLLFAGPSGPPDQQQGKG